MVKTKWLIYTVIIGLIPFIIRFFVFLFYKGSNANFLLNEVDFILFGLVLNLSNINELENNRRVGKIWKTQKIGVSLFFIIIFSTFLMLAYLSEIEGVELSKVIFKISTALMNKTSRRCFCLCKHSVKSKFFTQDLCLSG